MEADSDEDLRPDAQAAQMPGQPISAPAELGIGDAGPFEFHGDRVGKASCLTLDGLMDRLVTVERAAARAPLEQLRPFVGRQDGQKADRRLDVFGDRFENRGEVAEHANDRFTAESRPVVRDPQQQLPLAVREEIQRSVRLRYRAERSMKPRASQSAQSGAPELGFGHDDALEEGGSPRNLAPSLDLHERRVFVRPHRQPLRAQLLKHCEKRPVGRDTRADRQRVDEETDHRFRPREPGRTALPRRAEHDVFLSAVASHQTGPRPLHEGVQGEAVLRRQRA